MTPHAALVPHVSLGCLVLFALMDSCLLQYFYFLPFVFLDSFYFVKARLLFFNRGASVSSCFSILHSDDVGPKIIRSLLDVKAKPHGQSCSDGLRAAMLP